MSSPNKVEFTGVLTDRQYTLGQKYAQLVFETTDGTHLSLTRDITMAQSLRLGLTYDVKGVERVVGKKRYIHDPTAKLAAPAKKPAGLSKRYKILIPAAVSTALALGGVGALAYATQGTGVNNQPETHETKQVTESASVASSDTSSAPHVASSASDEQPKETTPASSPKRSSSTSTTTPKKTTSSTSKPTAPAPSGTTTPTAPQEEAPAPPVEDTPPAEQTPPPTDPPSDPPPSDPEDGV